MTTSTGTAKTAKKSTPTPAKKAATPAPAKKATPAPAAKASTEVKGGTTYREVTDFSPALKAAKSLAKGNVDMTQPLQLITHLAWKTPGGSVGWAKGTTANVIAFADDIAVPSGTPIPDAMDAALAVASKAATDKPQKDAMAVLTKVVKGHTG